MKTWKGHKILAKDDAYDLERQAALLEFRDKIPREEAENQVYNAYVRQKCLNGAAFHLAGVKAARAVGNTEDAKKHLLAYGLNMKQMGLEPVGPVPEEVASLVDRFSSVYGFKPHESDGLFVDGNQS